MRFLKYVCFFCFPCIPDFPRERSVLCICLNLYSWIYIKKKKKKKKNLSFVQSFNRITAASEVVLTAFTPQAFFHVYNTKLCRTKRSQEANITVCSSEARWRTSCGPGGQKTQTSVDVNTARCGLPAQCCATSPTLEALIRRKKEEELSNLEKENFKPSHAEETSQIQQCVNTKIISSVGKWLPSLQQRLNTRFYTLSVCCFTT